jgi:hypothetical protein
VDVDVDDVVALAAVEDVAARLWPGAEVVTVALLLDGGGSFPTLAHISSLFLTIKSLSVAALGDKALQF